MNNNTGIYSVYRGLGLTLAHRERPAPPPLRGENKELRAGHFAAATAADQELSDISRHSEDASCQVAALTRLLFTSPRQSSNLYSRPGEGPVEFSPVYSFLAICSRLLLRNSQE